MERFNLRARKSLRPSSYVMRTFLFLILATGSRRRPRDIIWALFKSCDRRQGTSCDRRPRDRIWALFKCEWQFRDLVIPVLAKFNIDGTQIRVENYITTVYVPVASGNRKST
jgi:hypothetical protein